MYISICICFCLCLAYAFVYAFVCTYVCAYKCTYGYMYVCMSPHRNSGASKLLPILMSLCQAQVKTKMASRMAPRWTTWR